MSSTLIVFTSKQEQEVIEIGGSGWWKLNAAKANEASHVLLVHNAKDKRRLGDNDRHGKAFMLATIRELKQDEADGRWLIQLDEFADVEGSYAWPGFRNPVNYADSDEILGQLTVGDWQKMPEVDFEHSKEIRRTDDASVARLASRIGAPEREAAMSFAEIIALHRNEIAAQLGVEPAQVQITVGT